MSTTDVSLLLLEVIRQAADLIEKQRAANALSLLKAALLQYKPKMSIDLEDINATSSESEPTLNSYRSKTKKSKTKRRKSIKDPSKTDTESVLNVSIDGTDLIEESSSEEPAVSTPATPNTTTETSQSNEPATSEVTPRSNLRRTSLAALGRTTNQPLDEFVVSETRKQAKRSEKQENMWKNVIKELYTTEKDFIRDLKLVIELFKEPMEAKKLITAEESVLIFSNIKTILTVNEELFRQLESFYTPPGELVRRASEINTQLNTDLAKVTGVLKVQIKVPEADFLDRVVNKSISINGTTTFSEIYDFIRKKLDPKGAGLFVNFHFVSDANNETVLDTGKRIFDFIKYDKTKLQFTFKKDAVSKAMSVGDALLNMSHYLKVYSEYCGTQMRGSELLRTLERENPEMKAFLRNMMKDKRCRRLDLYGFLVMPLQRVCKYPLLIRELLVATPEKHPDYPSLIQASRKIGETVLTINEKKREYDELQLIGNLVSNIDGMKNKNTLIGPARRLIKQANIFVVMKKSLDKAFYHLFSDMLLITSEEDDDGHYKYVDMISLSGAIISESIDFPYAFKITHKSKFIELAAKSEKEKNKLKDIVMQQITKEMYEEWKRKSKDTLSYKDWLTLYSDQASS